MTSKQLLGIWAAIVVVWAGYVSAQPHSYFGYQFDRFAYAILPPLTLLPAGLVCRWLWRRFAGAYWTKLPAYLRKGLVRIYLVISIPWLAWFGLEILVYGPRWRYFAHALSLLPVLPIGAPVLCLLVGWVLAGFRKSDHAASDLKHSPAIGPQSPQPPPKGSPPDTCNVKSSDDYLSVGKALGRNFFEPDIWHEMTKLSERDKVTAHEFAYARVAIIRDAIRRVQPRGASQMLAGVDQYVTSSLAKQEHAATALIAIQFYEQNAPQLQKLADLIVHRSLNSVVDADQITTLLEMVAEEAERLIKISSLLEKFSEPTFADRKITLSSRNGLPSGGKVKPKPTVMDAFVKLAYGDPPRPETADLQEAIELSGTLLGRIVGQAEIREVATPLYTGPLPYSTHDLAVATALHFFETAKGSRHEELRVLQMMSRLTIVDWVKEKKLNRLLAKTFEDTLYERFKPRA